MTVDVCVDDVSRCPVGDVCVACGLATRPLSVCTINVGTIGVGCVTVCPCVAGVSARPLPAFTSPLAALDSVADHCGHLGITLDDMAALISV